MPIRYDIVTVKVFCNSMGINGSIVTHLNYKTLSEAKSGLFLFCNLPYFGSLFSTEI